MSRTVDLTRIMILSPIFLALGSLVTSVLNARGRFAASAIAPIVYNLAIIGGAIFLAPTFGITSLDAFPTHTFARSATLWLSDEFVDQSEPEVAGWLLVAETLVPVMFAALRPSFVGLGCDTRYFDEHVEVDTDEHAAWMAESVEDVLELYGGAATQQITAGMIDAWQETREVPDALWRKQCASH